MKTRLTLFLSVLLLGASCAPLSQMQSGAPRFSDAVYTRPEKPTRTVPVYSMEDFEKLAEQQGKIVPDSLPLENSGWSYSYSWQAPYSWDMYPYAWSYGMPMYSGCYGWNYPGSHFGCYSPYGFYNPYGYYSPWEFSRYYAWYDPYGWYNSWYFGMPYDPWYPHHHWDRPGPSSWGHASLPGHSYQPRASVQGGGRSDSGRRLPGGNPSYSRNSVVNRSQTSEPGVTPRQEGIRRTGSMSGSSSVGSYPSGSTGNYSRGSTATVQRGSSASQVNGRSSSSYSGSSSHVGSSGSGSYGGGGGSSHSGGSSGGGGGGRR